MTYLLAQLWLFLLIAGLIGSVLGWLLRGGCKHYRKAIREIEARYVKLEKENNRIKKKNASFNKVVLQRNQLLAKIKKLNTYKEQAAKLSQQLMKIQLGLKKARKVNQHLNQKLQKSYELLRFAKQNNLAQAVKLKKLKKEAIVVDNLLLKCHADWNVKYEAVKSQQEKDKSASQQVLQQLQSKLDEVTAKLSDSRDENSAQLQEVQAKLAETEASLMEERSKREALANALSEKENEKNNAESQLNLFKDQSKEYIGKIVEENAKYKVGVELLEGDIAEWEGKYAHKVAEIQQIDDNLQNKEAEIYTLKDQLTSKSEEIDALSAQLKVAQMEIKDYQTSGTSIKSLKSSAHSSDDKKSIIGGGEENESFDQNNTRLVEEKHFDSLSSNSINDASHTPKINLINPRKEGSKNASGVSVHSYFPPLIKHPMVHGVGKIYGVGKAYEERLAEQGILTTEDLLNFIKAKKTVSGESELEKQRTIKELAQAINADPAEVTAWVRMADLLRLEKLSDEDAKVLELSGIHSVNDLVEKKATDIAATIADTLQGNRRIKNIPGVEEILTWVDQATHLAAEQREERTLQDASQVKPGNILNSLWLFHQKRYRSKRKRSSRRR